MSLFRGTEYGGVGVPEAVIGVRSTGRPIVRVGPLLFLTSRREKSSMIGWAG
jgi:hypothetical protein